MERILDQTRKFGLHAVLAHQRIGQLKERGEGIYNAVMGGTQTKIVLGGLSDDDAAIMAREIMRGDIDLESAKSMTAPVVVDEVPFWLESTSESEGSATSRSYSESFSTTEGVGSSAGTSESYMVVDGQEMDDRTMAILASQSTSSTTTTGRSAGESFTTSQSRTVGRSQTLKAVRELRPTHYHTLEESLHLAQLKLRNLPDRAAIVKRRGKRTVRVETVEVKGVLNSKPILARFRERTSTKSPYMSPIAAARAEIEKRQADIFGTSEAPKGDEQFWSKE